MDLAAPSPTGPDKSLQQVEAAEDDPGGDLEKSEGHTQLVALSPRTFASISFTRIAEASPFAALSQAV